jgi:hypothetical protein
LNQNFKKQVNPKLLQDRIEETAIFLNGEGIYPKDVIITDRFGRIRKYLLRKTPKGGYLLI